MEKVTQRGTERERERVADKRRPKANELAKGTEKGCQWYSGKPRECDACK